MKAGPLEAEGFSRGPKKKVRAGTEFVAVRPGMTR